MAGEYMIKVGLQLDKAQASSMENDLNKRFGRVATKFSARLGTGLKRLAYSGLLMSAVGAILQPIDKLNDKINNTLDKFADIKAQASGFGVNEAEYLKSRVLAESVGVQNFDAIFAKFRDELIKANKGIPSSLEQFRGSKGTVEDFLTVLSSLQAMKPEPVAGKEGTDTRQIIISQIFGQDQLKEVNKLISADLKGLAEKLNVGNTNEQINNALNRVNALKQQQVILQGRRDINELLQAPNIVNGNVLSQQDDYYRRQNELLNEQIKQYSNVASLQKGVDSLVQTTNVVASKAGNILDEMRSYFKFKSSDTRQKMDRLGLGAVTFEQFKELDSKGVFD